MTSYGIPPRSGRQRIALFGLPPLILAAVAGLAFVVGPAQPGSSALHHVKTPAGPVDFTIRTGTIAKPDPSWMADDDNGLHPAATAPLYLDGGERLATVVFDKGHLTSSVTFVPHTSALFIRGFGGCAAAAPADATLHVQVEVGSTPGYDVSCGRTGQRSAATPFSILDPAADYASIGVVAGRPTTLSVTASTTPAGADASGSFVVYEAIPPWQWILPPAPAKLALAPAGGNPILVDSRKGAVNGQWRVTVRPGETVALHRAAPGELVVACDGKVLYDVWQYDWSSLVDSLSVGTDALSSPCVVDSPGGSTVTLEVTAKSFTRPGWFVEELVHPDPEPTVGFVCSPDRSTCTADHVSYPSTGP